MSVKLQQPFIYDDFSSGMIDRTAVSDSLMPRNAVRKAINCVFDNPRGAVSGRLGATVVGNNLSNQIRGLFNFRDAGAGTNHRLIVTDNLGVTRYLSGASFVTTLSGDSVALKTRFVTFLDRVARLNGTNGAASWDGDAASSWLTTGGPLDVGNWPARSQFAVVFNSRIYTAGDTSNPTTLSYSSVPSGGAISWTSGNGSLLINPSDDAGNITGLVNTGTILLIFKERSMYRWDGSSTFANKVIDVGCPSFESIVNPSSGWIYFFGIDQGSVGFFRTSGGYPQLISRNIPEWVAAIAGSNYADVAGFCDEDHVYWSVGNVTVNNETYNNAWFVYTVSLQTWHIESHSTGFRVFATFVDSNTNETIVGGDTAGNVMTINSGTTDNGTAIAAECEFLSIIFTTRGRVKSVPTVTTYSPYPQGLKFYMKIDEHDYQEVGANQKIEQRFSFLNYQGQQFRGHKFYPKISVSSGDTAWQFDGFEFNEVFDEGFEQ